METDQSYKSKVEQMTVLLKHYQNELESQKVRRDGVETVSRLLAESRQENVALKKNMIAMETTMKNLKNRLVANGLCPGVEADDNEVIVPGTSKQTLTNLAMENKRLRSMLQHDSSTESVNDSDSLQKPAKITETEQALQQTVDKLQTENKSMKMKLSDLENLYRSSNNEKDRQLMQLKEEVEQLQQRSGEKTEPLKVGTGLPALKEQLRAFMARCEDFGSVLDQMQEASEAKEEAGVELTPIVKQAVERADSDSVDGVEIKQVMEEKQKLQDRVEEVTKMNQRWQEFFNERERYTQSLEQKVQELEERLKEAMRMGPTQEINRRIEQVLEKSQKEIGQMDELRQKAEDEVQRLRHEVASRDGQVAQLQSQVTILSQAPRQLGSAEASSTIEHLKAQIQVCTEDFEKERQDRQVALQKVTSLQEQNVQLRKVNAHLQTLVQQSQQVVQPSTHMARPPAQEHGQSNPHNLPPHNLQPRGAHFRPSGFDFEYDCPQSPENNGGWRDYPDFDYEVPGSEHLQHTAGHLSMPSAATELIARGPLPRQPLSESAVAPSETPKQNNVLTCPKCNKEFSEERQGELLAHMDVCWE
ncbi:uncharacterized protein LOC143293759 [Babylonia areolata]|uniref:uncharacterized protein LOC143293759 n=1 Tax=Babylonia areolata TaxID=304850 RepID=UPI003FD497B6